MLEMNFVERLFWVFVTFSPFFCFFWWVQNDAERVMQKKGI